MKLTIVSFSLLAMLLPACLLGQSYAVDRGVIMADGVVSFSSAGGDLYENSDGDKQTAFLLNPTVGYFCMPNLVGGLELLFASNTQGDHKTTATGLGPKLAYYIGDSSSDLFPFIGASLMWVKGKHENSLDWEETKMNIHLSAGATKMIAKNVGITAKVVYSMDSYKPEDADEAVKGNKITIGIGISTFIF